MIPDQGVFEAVKYKLNQILVPGLFDLHKNVVIGVGTVAGNTSHTNGDTRLGGYLKNVQEPIKVRAFPIPLDRLTLQQ